MKKTIVAIAAGLLVGCIHPANEKPRFYSTDSGSGYLVGYDQNGEPVYGSGKPWKKGDKSMRR